MTSIHLVDDGRGARIADDEDNTLAFYHVRPRFRREPHGLGTRETADVVFCIYHECATTLPNGDTVRYDYPVGGNYTTLADAITGLAADLPTVAMLRTPAED
jgi:hypothetical protein